jgi:hypothetical protein
VVPGRCFTARAEAGDEGESARHDFHLVSFANVRAYARSVFLFSVLL